MKNWYKLGEKLIKFFLNLEEHGAIQKSQTNSVIINQNKITDQDEINKLIFSFYQSLFSHKVQNQTDKTGAYLELILLPTLANE